MALATIEAQRRFPYSPDDLCRLVGDVTSYPRFIPWVKTLSVESAAERPGGGWEGLARAVVGWRSVTERFATYVRCAPERGEVEVRLAEGPFKSLENHWTFQPAPGGGSFVHFRIAYEFKNPILQALASVNRRIAADRIIAAFEAEAQRRFGGAKAENA